MQNYAEWINKNFEVDKTQKTLEIKNSKQEENKSSSSAGSDAKTCSHTKVHHKGSSARYERSTCKDCGFV